MLIRTADGVLRRCPTPPVWWGTWRTTAGQTHAVLLCEDHRGALDLVDARLLGCE